MIGNDAKIYLADRAVRSLSELDPWLARVLADELKQLEIIEYAARETPPVVETPEGYYALALPSGYMVLFRRLSDLERKEILGEFDSDVAGYLVADVTPLVPISDVTDRLAAGR